MLSILVRLDPTQSFQVNINSILRTFEYRIMILSILRSINHAIHFLVITIRCVCSIYRVFGIRCSPRMTDWWMAPISISIGRWMAPGPAAWLISSHHLKCCFLLLKTCARVHSSTQDRWNSTGAPVEYMYRIIIIRNTDIYRAQLSMEL